MTQQSIQKKSRGSITKSLFTISLVLAPFASHAGGCAPLSVGGSTVTFTRDEGLKIKSPDGRITKINLPDAVRPACESLKLSEGPNKDPSLAELTYVTGEIGTKVLIENKIFLLINIKDQAPAAEPVTLDETFRRPHDTDRTQIASVAWKHTADGFVLQKTDLETDEVSQIWPKLSNPAPVAAPATPSPVTPSPAQRPPPAGTEGI